MKRGALFAAALCGLASTARAAEPAGDKEMRREDKLILALAIAGSVASVGVGGYVHYRLMRGGGAPEKGGSAEKDG